MTSQIDGSGSVGFEPYSPQEESKEEEEAKVTVSEGQSGESVPDWKVREERRKIEIAARDALITQELRHEIARETFPQFQTVFKKHEKDLRLKVLHSVYKEAINTASPEFLEKIDLFLHQQKYITDSSYFERLIEEVDHPQTLEHMIASGLLSQECIQNSLDHFFQSGTIRGKYDRKGELPHRLELAQILMDHGANPWDENSNSAWYVAMSNQDTPGLKLMMNHPKFDPMREKRAYIGQKWHYLFQKQYELIKVWGEESKVGMREEKAACAFYESVHLVLDNHETLQLIKSDLTLPYNQKRCIAAILLPFISTEVNGVTPEMRSHLVMDFVLLFPHLYFGNPFILHSIAPALVTKLKGLELDEEVIAKRLLKEALHYFRPIPKNWRTNEDEGDDAYDISMGFVTISRLHYALSKNEKIRNHLLKLEGGKECLVKIESLQEDMMKTMGSAPPWEMTDNFGKNVVDLASRHLIHTVIAK